MKKFLRALSILLLLGLGFLYILKTPELAISQTILKTIGLERLFTGENTLEIANPASVYCIENSGTLEITIDASGNQAGLCHLVDGTTCDEWAYFRGECPETGAVTTGSEFTGNESTGKIMDQINQNTETDIIYTINTNLTGSLLTGTELNSETVEQVSQNIKNVTNQTTSIKNIFQKDGKWFGVFHYLQYGNCDYPCREETGIDITIEINTKGNFYYYGSPVFLDDGGGPDGTTNLNLQKISFDNWYTNIHPYGNTHPKLGIFNDVFIIDIHQGFVEKIEAEYQS